MRPYSSDPFRDNQRAASQSLSHLVKDGGQKMPSQFGTKPTLANTGLDLVLKARAIRQAQQEQDQAERALEQMQRREYALSLLPGSRLVVPGRMTGPIGSSQLIPAMFNINRLGQSHSPVKPPRIERHRVDARPATKPDDEAGIVVYGRQMYTHTSVPLLIIKTRLISKRIQTEMTALSNDVIVHKPVDALVIDLSRYDYLRDLKSSDLPEWFDAVIVNVGGDFAFLGGTGACIQIVIILKGQFRGLYVYKPTHPNANFGFSLSVGAAFGTVDFNERNSRSIALNGSTFEGRSQGWSAGWRYSGGVTTAYTDGQWHPRDMWGLLDRWGVNEADVLYRTYMASGPQTTLPLATGLEFGGQYSFSRSELFEWGQFPFDR